MNITSDFALHIDREFFDREFLRVVREYNISHEKWQEEQLAEAFKQAVACGDFIRNVCKPLDSEAVFYMPFYREQQLMNRIRELESENDRLRSE